MNTTKRTDRKQFAEAANAAIFYTIVGGIKHSERYPVFMARADAEVQAQRTVTAKDAAREAVEIVRSAMRAADTQEAKQAAIAGALREIAARASITVR